ncbi:MAG: S8 family peptidase [Bacteroidota bacterium]
MKLLNSSAMSSQANKVSVIARSLKLNLALGLFLFFLSVGCSTVKPTAEEPISKEAAEKPAENWHHQDHKDSPYPGISSEKAYDSLLQGKKPKKEVIVAVIDSGIDIEHDDLENIIWVNEDEIPGNDQDDDDNGYVDDVHGWNFIGGPDGENVSKDSYELTRQYTRLKQTFSKLDTTSLNPKQQENFNYYKKLKEIYIRRVKNVVSQYNSILSFENALTSAQDVLANYYGTTDYSIEQVKDLKTESQQLAYAQNITMHAHENDIDSTLLAEEKKRVYELAKYTYNPDFDTRHIVGDNYDDKTERFYGNPDVIGADARHGTHVAGIIAAERDNKIGMNGVAVNTRIMPIRTVPDGDERDKDVANAIRYAVDNGADIINMSFGKSYSPYKEVVDAAIQYADSMGVLMVHGAGNDGDDSDQEPNYPTDIYGSTLDGPTFEGPTASLWISVGASNWERGENMVANFSNYGQKTVDVFAPGMDIYSATPENNYEQFSGTSMASPVVAGTAALIMAYYPDLTPHQIKQIILESAIRHTDQQVIVPGSNGEEEETKSTFGKLSVTGGVVNAFEALKMAEEMSQSSQ